MSHICQLKLSPQPSFSKTCSFKEPRKFYSTASLAVPNVSSLVQIVCVWEMKNVGSRERSPVQLQLKHTLHGHTDSVTCIAASTAYNIIVSGSKVSCNNACISPVGIFSYWVSLL